MGFVAPAFWVLKYQVHTSTVFGEIFLIVAWALLC